MKKEKIKPLPVVKEFTDYFIRKAKRKLKLKRADYISITVDYTTRGFVYVWFHGKGAIVGQATYKEDGTSV